MIDVNDLNVVVTGKVAGESRESAEAKLRNLGAHVHSSVTKTTHLLICGAAVGATKMNAAAAKGARIATWEEVMLGPAQPLEQTTPAKRKTRGASQPLAARPAQIAPMLALGGEPMPDNDGWMFEVKWDGYRGIATVKDGVATIQSRSGKSDLTPRFPEIVDELAGLPDCVLDGELVVLNESGVSSFQALTGASNNGVTRYIVFDVLSCTPQGDQVKQWPLRARKVLLRGLLEDANGTLVAESPVFDDGAQLLEVARERGFEGIIAKRADSTYQEGRRGPDWRKFKVRCEQEFVVAGWTPGEGKLENMVGALILAVNEGGELIFAGKVGTGFDDDERNRLLAELRKRKCAGPNIKLTDKQRKQATRDQVTWVRPTLVVQVEFQRWTEDGVLWHPAYTGQRTDKIADDVVREPCLAA